MKKITKSLIFLIGALVGFGLGVGLIAMLERIPDLSKGEAIALCIFALAMFYAFFFIEIILHEAGHLLFGLLTGWRFVSFRIANILWHRDANGRLRRSKYSLAGTAGQCLMAPPPWQAEGFPCALYNLGGVIVNLATAAICGLLAWRNWDHALAALLLLEAAAVGLLLGITNGIPLPGLIVANDGSNLVSVLKSRDARRALWLQMSIAAAQAEGLSLRDMPEDWFAPFPEASMDNPLISAIAVFTENRLIDALDLPGAEAAIRALLAREKGILPLHRALLTLDGACCELLAGQSADLTTALDTPAVQQVMKAMKTCPTVLRTQYITALLRDHDEAQAAIHLKAFEKMAKTYPYQQDLASERSLMAIAKEAADTHAQKG